jgi:Mrp family chromosome partitioning ATPase
VDSPPWVENPEPDDPGKGRETRFPNLYVLPAGPPVRDPAGVLHVAFGRMIDSLRDSFEVILIDSPPVLPVSDAKITARWVDTVVLVVAARTDKPSSVARTIEELRIAEAKIKGVVLNRTAEPIDGFDHYRPAHFDGEGAERSIPATRSVSTARDES